MQTRTYIGVAIVCVCIVGVALYFVLRGKGGDESATPPAQQVPVVLPDFRLPNEQGVEVVFTDVEAQVRVVNFWASWSPYSVTELPALVQLKQEFGDQIEIVALNRDTNREDGKAFLRSLNLGSELLFAYDTADTYYSQVGGYNMPETIFVGADEEVLAHIHGPMTYEAMRTQLVSLLD